jgi:nucleoside 2-deoxyribosyltransferase
MGVWRQYAVWVRVSGDQQGNLVLCIPFEEKDGLQKIFARDMNWLAQCDLFLAEVTGSSFGLAFETGYLLGATTKTTLSMAEFLRLRPPTARRHGRW